MIITLVALSVLALAFLAATGWERRKWRLVQAPTVGPATPLPSFIREPHCIKCDTIIRDDDGALDQYWRAQVGNKVVPVTVSLCKDCVDRA